MKHVKFALLALAVTFSFCSCKHDYVCRCTGGVAKSGYDVNFHNESYQKAKNDCEKMSGPNTTGADYLSCELLVD